MDLQKLFISNGFVQVQGKDGKPQTAALGTILSNLASYGYAPSKDALKALTKLSDSGLTEFWRETEPSLKAVTGADRNMDDFVVYKNFPKEVLNMSDAQYWCAQSLMYAGLPNELFTEEAEERAPLETIKGLKVLELATDATPRVIYAILESKRARWTDDQKLHVTYLFDTLQKNTVDIAGLGFRENGVLLAAHAFEKAEINTGAATDVLRLAAALSGGDLSLRETFKFKKFSRADRQRLLRVLEETPMDEDFSLRPDKWKKLLRALRPGDYKNQFPKCVAAYDVLYRGAHDSYPSRLEKQLAAADPAALKTLAERPGVFARRLHESYGKFGRPAFEAFKTVATKLDTQQLVKLDRYMATISTRIHLMHPPKGNWARVQVLPNTKPAIAEEDRTFLRETISTTLKAQIAERYPEGFDADEALVQVKLQTNDQKLAAYGRGTEFDIPENITFIRSASFWATPSLGSVWFDNGWNFFDTNWREMGSCCWSSGHQTFADKGAVFSGDPTNAKDLKGRACQMIDLYIDKLLAKGVRFGVWNVLAYSSIKFEDGKDVLATLQMGEEAQKGKLYEPARAQMVFPLKGPYLTKYVAYVDLERRKLVYMDASFAGKVHAADANGAILSKIMPAFVEYLDSLPSVADLLQNNPGTIPAVYSDAGYSIASDRAYAFKRENDANSFEQIDITQLIG